MTSNSKAFRKQVTALFFMNIVIDNLRMQLFHFLNRTMCLSKKILYRYFVVFCHASISMALLDIDIHALT